MTNLIGIWKLSRIENIQDYLKYLGIGYLKIHMGKSATQFDPTLTIKLEHSNIWSIKMESNLKNKEITFVDNEEFATLYKEKKASIGLIKIESENKMVEQLKDPETKKIQATIVRELMGDTLVETFTAKETVCTLVFEKDI